MRRRPLALAFFPCTRRQRPPRTLEHLPTSSYAVPDAAVSFADHLDHARLDQRAGAFEPGLVEFAAYFDRLTPQKTPWPNGRETWKWSQLGNIHRRLVA